MNMPIEITNERLSDLLVDPRERLDFEVKNWLDLQVSNEDKATFAKAVLALANHGGGFIALGLVETDNGIIEAEGDLPRSMGTGKI
jgi:predicted HTH transcriptional regulator